MAKGRKIKAGSKRDQLVSIRISVNEPALLDKLRDKRAMYTGKSISRTDVIVLAVMFAEGSMPA